MAAFRVCRDSRDQKRLSMVAVAEALRATIEHLP